MRRMVPQDGRNMDTESVLEPVANVTAEPETEPWLVEYLREDRGVRLLWLKGGDLAGPDLPLLLESGSDALRRRERGTNPVV